jgi:DNA-binding transcriptional MerR regulator
MDTILLISDAAKEVHVESHVLRYWEEELHLPIKRNELGHRFYTKEDVERFKQIKSMKEGGLQLKAIKMILKDGKLDVLSPEQGKTKKGLPHPAEEEANRLESLDPMGTGVAMESREDKARRLQWLLQQLIRETLQENNRELCREIKETVVKELDYQFRTRDEKEEERTRLQDMRNETYYQRMDDLLRKKSRSRKKEPPVTASRQVTEGIDNLTVMGGRKGKKEKRKRRSIF